MLVVLSHLKLHKLKRQCVSALEKAFSFITGTYTQENKQYLQGLVLWAGLRHPLRVLEQDPLDKGGLLCSTFPSVQRG